MGNERSPGEGPEGEVDAGDPTEEVGAEECEAGTLETEYKAGSIDETANATFPKFMDEVADAYSPDPGMLVPSPIDGLPLPANEPEEPATAPPFTIDHVVCVEDDREYVEVFREEHDGDEMSMFRSEYDHQGKRRERLRFSPDRVIEHFGRKFVDITKEEKTRERGFSQYSPFEKLEADGIFEGFSTEIESFRRDSRNEGHIRVFVRPARERCKHYMRQVLSHDGQPDPNEPGHRIIFRNCTIRRSVGGAFMGLRDEAVYACDYRDPPHIESVKKFLDDPDHDKLRSEAYKVKLPLFRKG